MEGVMGILHRPHRIVLGAFNTIIIPIHHSILELFYLISENFRLIFKTIFYLLASFAIISGLGFHDQAIWCLRWVGLGILSSIGFGFGMHTFVLFLAPHIASVTMAAHNCKTLNFPQPPYPYEITCPSEIDNIQVTWLAIFLKVIIESFMWGLGTAIGELPPYLAARLRAMRRGAAGDNHGEDELAGAWELWIVDVIKKIGFLGILLCAAIPNPLFDAAGIASGTAKVPFLSFFGATLIGKALIKASLQSAFIISLFHKDILDKLLSLFGDRIATSVGKFLQEQRNNVLKKTMNEPAQKSLISSSFNWLIRSIMIIFTISLIRHLDKQYSERMARRSSAKIK